MKIAISCHPTQGGSGIVATELAMALAKRGHEIHIASCVRPFRLDESSGVVFHKLNVTDYPLFRFPPHDLCLANKLAEIIKQYAIDIVHAHYAIPHAISAILAREVVGPCRVKAVTTLHGTDITLVGSNAGFYDITRYAMQRCAGVTAVSKWLQNETMEKFRLTDAPRVIPNFIDTGKFNPEGRIGYPPDGVFQLLHASNFRPVKRVTDIVRVFQKIREHVDAHLTFVGDGPDCGLAKELVGELGLCREVTFMAPTVDMVPLLRRSHLFFLLSHYESFGLSALEAMACGVPVAVTNAGGLPEVVEDGVSGLLCDIGDIAGVAEKIVKLLRDRAAWEAMSGNAAARAAESFPAEKIVRQYEDYYREIMEHKSAKE